MVRVLDKLPVERVAEATAGQVEETGVQGRHTPSLNIIKQILHNKGRIKWHLNSIKVNYQMVQK